MTREQGAKWVQKRLRESGDGWAIFWGVMVFFWGLIFLSHLVSIGEFKFESVIVAMLFLSAANLARIFQMRKYERVLGVLFGESWRQVSCPSPNASIEPSPSPTDAPPCN